MVKEKKKPNRQENFIGKWFHSFKGNYTLDTQIHGFGVAI